ncbi:MAG: TPM domain-containing protein, partial [Longicatena sp.]|nr:TPM domain-containing protein [Longicatena sp.]
MKKVMIFLLLCTFMLTSMQLVQAQDSYIVDHYDQFSADEEQYYNEKASAFEQQYDLSVMIVNLETTNDDPTDEVHRVYSDKCDNMNALIIAYSDAYYNVVPYGSAVSLINDSIWDAYYNGGYTMTQRTDALFAKMQELVHSNHGVEDEDEKVEKGAYFVDDAQLFDASQEQELLTYFENLSNDLGVEVIGVTTNDMNGNDAESYARQYYDDYDYDSDGIIMMIDMEDRSWALVSMGDLRNAFVRDVRDQMSNAFVPYLSGGDYVEAFKQYGADVSTYYQLYKNHGADYYDELDKLYYEQNKGTIFMMGAGG